jgi:hypothetical protein
MTPNQLKQVNKIRSILTMLWAKKGMTEFHYTDATEIISKHHGGLAWTTSFVNIGLMAKTRKGHYVFCRKPNEADAVKTYEDSIKMIRKRAIIKDEIIAELRRKAEEVKSEQEKSELKIIDEQYCIDYLKAKGYKIMKPIQPQYEEI